MTILLAFDIGTNLGYAIGPKGGRPRLGVVPLEDKRHIGWWLRSGDDRIRELLGEANEVVCERPFAIQDAGAAKNFALLGHILWWATHKGVTCHPSLSPNTTKKHFTGRGDASKDDMLSEAQRRGFMPSCYDEADACAAWYTQDAGPPEKPKKKRASQRKKPKTHPKTPPTS